MMYFMDSLIYFLCNNIYFGAFYHKLPKYSALNVTCIYTVTHTKSKNSRLCDIVTILCHVPLWDARHSCVYSYLFTDDLVAQADQKIYCKLCRPYSDTAL